MTQYCRYCSLAVLNDDDLIYCEAKDEMREGKQIRNPNKCKHFEFNPVDVLDENKKYRPREPKKKNIEGQVSFLQTTGNQTCQDQTPPQLSPVHKQMSESEEI